MLLQAFVHKTYGDFTLYRKTGHDVSAVNYGTLAFFPKLAEGNHDIFRRLAADDKGNFLSYGIFDGFVKLKAAHLDELA